MLAQTKLPHLPNIPDLIPDIGPPAAFKTYDQICRDAGYKYESRTVVTEDGYALQLGRVAGHGTDDNIQSK